MNDQRDSRDGRHEHFHDARNTSRRRLWWALVINLAFLLVEVVGGLITGSLALLADAGHMLTDVAALALAVFVARLASRPATPRSTYGFLRAEVIGAFVNGATLVVVVGFVFWEAWKRLGEPVAVDAPPMLAVAVIGLLANVAGAWILFAGRGANINVRGAFLHLAADALGSLGVIGAAAVIWTTGWTLIDPIASVFIGVLILWSSIRLLRDSMSILMEETPGDVDYEAVRRALTEHGHVVDVHDLHIWTITSGMPGLTAHLRLSPECEGGCHWHVCLRGAQDMLRERFNIVHATLQLEPYGYTRDDRPI